MTNPLLTCRHLRAERPHYHPTANCCPCDTLRRVVRPAGTVGKNVSKSAKNVSESEKIVSEFEKLCFAPCLRRRRLFSSERRVRHVATAVAKFLRQLTPSTASPFLTLPQQLRVPEPTHMLPISYLLYVYNVSHEQCTAHLTRSLEALRAPTSR